MPLKWLVLLSELFLSQIDFPRHKPGHWAFEHGYRAKLNLNTHGRSLKAANGGSRQFFLFQ
jgi:hypothetical protein